MIRILDVSEVWTWTKSMVTPDTVAFLRYSTMSNQMYCSSYVCIAYTMN